MTTPCNGAAQDLPPTPDEGSVLHELLLPLLRHWKLLVAVPLLTGVMALGVTYLLAPTFTARASFLAPQAPQSSALTALSSLGPLAGLAGAAGGGLRTIGDQYAALLQSTTMADRIIDAFGLIKSYDVKFRQDARRELAENVRVGVGKKDNVIAIEVDDGDPKRAAAMAMRFIDELRLLTGRLALTEAQQRRVFFEAQLAATRDRLALAQEALLAGGFSRDALKAEPKAAAEDYAKLRAQVTTAEVRLQSLRSTLVDSTTEVQQQQTVLAALRAELARVEAATAAGTGGPDYVGRYREFKYQETLFELYARQFELARLDESREGALIQVLDEATPPERKSRPKRAVIAAATTLATAVLMIAFLLLRESWQRAQPDRGRAERIASNSTPPDRG